MQVQYHHFKIEFYRSGLFHELHDTCKITHKLSGEFVESNTEPYIYNNKLKAFQELFTKLNINQKFLMDFVNQPDIPNFKYSL